MLFMLKNFGFIIKFSIFTTVTNKVMNWQKSTDYMSFWNIMKENNISPNSPYMNGQEIGNVPIHEEDRLQPRHHIEQTLVPSTAPVNQARVAAEAEAYHCYSTSLLFCIVSVYAITIYCKCVPANQIVSIVYIIYVMITC
jgi:hypothetical protein